MNGHRKLIRERLAEILNAARVEIGIEENSVFQNRIRELSEKEKLPCLTINTKNERVVRIISDTPVREYELSLDCKIDCLTADKDESTLIDKLDSLVQKVTTVVLRNEMDQNNASTRRWGDLTYVSADLVTREEGGVFVGMGYLEFNIIYQATVDTVVPESFTEAAIDYEATVKPVEGSSGVAEATDSPVNIPQS